ncbi:DMT family transporter [Microvirga roseola]|uniref:DMT family transporter n=1 Tax=Microvirga roseola TaxID=2883126 RepID=UPI001E43C1F7|nr:DMT family transporter [Microvirga roseola]
MSERARGTVEMTVAMVILGTIGWFVVLSGQPVLTLVFWRCIFGAAALLVVCAGLGVLRGILDRRVLLYSALGGVAIVINWLLLFGSYSRASIAVATAVYSTQPFILVGLGVLFLSERLTATKLMWLGLAFAGMVLIVQAKPDVGYVGTDYLTGILMAFGAAFFYALTALFTKKLTGTPPHLIALIQVCIGIVMLLPFADLSKLPTDAGTWGTLAVLGIFYTGLMFTLQYGAIQKLPTHLTGSIYFVYPVVAIVVDVLAFGHRLHLAQVAGAAAILIAAAGMNLGWSLRRAAAPKTVAPAVE